MSAARRAGVVTFAGVLFVVVGLFTALDGVVALTRPETLYVGANALVVKDYDAWGVALVSLGGLQVLTGFGILSGANAARIIGIILAGIGFIVHLAYFKHYPAWSVTVMALDLIVIYALTVHVEAFSKGRR
jgi:hypothetical protein